MAVSESKPSQPIHAGKAAPCSRKAQSWWHSVFPSPPRDPEALNPRVQLAYQFFSDPHSSAPALVWGLAMTALVILRIFAIVLESCDGPNQYDGRAINRARYQFLLTKDQYYELYLGCMIPLAIDAVARMVMLAYVLFDENSLELLQELSADHFGILLYVSDIISEIPFLATVVYVEPNDVHLDKPGIIIMTLLELFIIGRLLRMIRDAPTVKAIRLTLSRSAGFLVLPVYFFFMFNITVGVIVYFLEPCYNIDSCPWHDLFEAAYFSVVTMTTTGYGNQTPSYWIGRLVAVCVMILGGMFMAMPLAIIGNEYDTVWTKVTEERKRRKREQLGEQQRQDEARLGLGSGCQQGQMPPITEEDELEEKADEDDPHIKLALLPSEQKEKLRKLSHGRQKGSDASATAALTSSAEKLPSSTDDLIHSVRFDVDGNNAGDVENNSNDYSSSSLDSEESFDISDDSDDSDENDFQVSENLPMDVLLCPLMVCYVQLLSCLDRLKKELSNTENSGNAGKLDNTLLLLHFGELRGWVPNLHFQLTAIYNQLTGSHESRRSSTVSAVHDVIGNKGGLAASNAVDSHSEQNHMFHYAEGSNSDSSDDEKDAAETFKQNLRRGSVALPSMMLQGSNLGMANRSNPLTGAKRLSSVAPSDGDNMASATHGGNNGISNVSSPFIRNNNVDHGSTGNAVATILSAPFLNRRLKSTMLSFIIPNRPSTTTSSVSPSVPSNSSGHYTSGVGSSDKREKIDGDDPMDRRQLFAQAAKQESFMSRVTGFGSLLTLVNGIAGDDVNHERELRKKNVDDEFLHKVEMVSKDPTALRSRIWIMLELPFSSNEARMLQYIFILLITTSVFVLFTQAVVNLSQYGESTEICGKVVELYCSDKIDSQMDPGCYVQMLNRTTNAVFTSSERLQFRCESHNCFGYGNNFGASVTNVTCSNPSYSPFQTKDDLEYTYRSPYVFTTRARMHMINPICTRIECKENIGSYNGNPVWIGFEFITNLVFTIEIVLRMVVSDSVLEYLNNTMNIFDILSILPFYIVLGRSKTITNLDFSILASSPEPVIFVILRSFQIFRMFKITRHFQVSKVLFETVHRVWKQILPMIALLVFLTIVFAIILFQLETGEECFVGDPGCVPPESVANIVREGDRLLINKEGEITQFGDVFDGLWFSFVTMTTVGYGDYSPVTIAGKAFSILLMLGGLFYLTMPITAAASTFYHYHEKYNRRNEVSDQLERAISPSSMEGSKSEAMDATAVGKKEDNGEEELQNDVNATNRNANKPNPSNVSSFRASLVARMSAQLDDNSINTTKVKLHVLMRGLDNINKEINHFFQHIKLPRRKRKSSSGLKEDSECIARFSDNSTADSGSVNMVVLGNFVSTVTTVAHTLDELLRPERENFVQFAKQYSVK